MFANERRATAVALLLLFMAMPLKPAFAQLSQSELAPINAGTLPIRRADPSLGRPIKPMTKQTLEDVFRKVAIRTTDPRPVDLSHLFVPGLSEGGAQQLAINLFVVANGTQYKTMSEIYAENRGEGKCNFITTDSIMHPYFAFANGMVGSAIEESLYADLEGLLKAMVQSSIADYRLAEDDEVKDDIQRNLAYLYVALKLLDERMSLPDIGGAGQLVSNDYELIKSGQRGRSLIFGTEEEFSAFQPWGFMTHSEKLKRFHLAYQWLSRMRFPLSNITKNTLEGGGNSFSRAVLLYRSLIVAKPEGESGVGRWSKIASVMALRGLDINAKRSTIVPPELASTIKTSPEDLDTLLLSLSQPFLRTKMLLAVRKQRPVELKARSIFEMGEKGTTDSDDVVFRVFPLTDPPELDWLKEVSHNYTENAEGPNPLPLGLFPLHAHGAAEATNLLAAQVDSLDKSLATKVPRLERVSRVLPSDGDQRIVDRHWSIISSLFRPNPDSVQIAIRSEMWLARQIESAIAAWIDSYSAYKPVPAGTAATDSTTSSAGTGEGVGVGVGVANDSATSGAGQASSSAAASGVVKADDGAASGAERTEYGVARDAANTARGSTAAGTAGGAASTAYGSTAAGTAGGATSTARGSTITGGGNVSPANAGTAANSRTRSGQVVRPPRFHYLEPRLDIYKQLEFDLQNLCYTLDVLKVLPDRYKARAKDFQRLFQRLQVIAEHEIKNEPIAVPDFSLMANIDRILAPVDSPLASNIYLGSSIDASQPIASGSKTTASKSSQRTGSNALQVDASMKQTAPAMPQRRSGATFGLGKASRLYIICNTNQGPMLARGGQYSYYEIAGGPVREDHWDRKLSYSTMLPPSWTRGFELVFDKHQKASPVSPQNSSRGISRKASYLNSD